MDRGIPTEDTLAQMRQADPPVSYLVGTPKGRLTQLETALLDLPWQGVRPGVDVKLLTRDDELYVLAQSNARIDKERAMRRRQLKWLWARLKQLSTMRLKREDLLMKLGAARAKAPSAWRLVTIAVARNAPTFTYRLDRNKLRQTRRREGRYLLRTNLAGHDPAQLWQFYIQLVEVEAAFKNLKDDLQLRPIHHQLEQRIEAPHLHRLLGLLSARHAPRPAQAPGRRPHSPCSARQARRHPDARRPLPHHRWPNPDPPPPYRAQRRPEHPAAPTRPHPAAPAPTAYHCCRSHPPTTARHVVETSAVPLLIGLDFSPPHLSS
ncbi:hypothetical protein ABID26_007252 [Mesorhizobium shonense]|uniref:Transposase n=1 Tax=Mesorhizobium shonense TaxID=1209948 RepID=A0ABV2I500_9HYPH